MLHVQLGNLGILSPGESIEYHPDFESFFRTVWVENADVISKRYTGTGALKTEFTKTGKKTLKVTCRSLIKPNNAFIGKYL